MKLTCSIGDANPEVTSYQLFRNGTDVGESNTKMWVKTLSNSGLSMDKCVANNSVGSSRSEDGNGRENVAEKVNSRSFNLHRDYSKSLTFSNIGEPS